MNMSGDLNDYLFAFIVLAVKIIMVAMFCLYMYFPLKQAIQLFDCKMGAFYKRTCYVLRLISCNESEIIISFKINAPKMSMLFSVIDNDCIDYMDLIWSLEMVHMLSVRQLYVSVPCLC